MTTIPQHHRQTDEGLVAGVHRNSRNMQP